MLKKRYADDLAQTRKESARKFAEALDRLANDSQDALAKVCAAQTRMANKDYVPESLLDEMNALRAKFEDAMSDLVDGFDGYIGACETEDDHRDWGVL